MDDDKKINEYLLNKYPVLQNDEFRKSKSKRLKRASHARPAILEIITNDKDKQLYEKYCKSHKKSGEKIDMSDTNHIVENHVGGVCDELVPISVENIEKETPMNSVIECIRTQKRKEESKNVWGNSPFNDITTLESNNVGEVGETFLELLCKKTGIESSIDGTKTKQKGGGSGDGKIKKRTNEIKTARLGNGDSKSFQHELGEYPWKAEFMTFIDISPNSIYLTIFPNFPEDFYKKSGNDKSKCEPYFPTKTITRRKDVGNFKLDTSIAINENNVKNGYTIKISEETTFDIVKDYINKNIT